MLLVTKVTWKLQNRLSKETSVSKFWIFNPSVVDILEAYLPVDLVKIDLDLSYTVVAP